MSRWVGFFIFAIVGLALFWCGLQMPVHLRAVDGAVLQKAGSDTPSLVDGGLSLVTNSQLGPAQLFLAAARSAWTTNSHVLSDAVENLAVRQPAPARPKSLANLPPADLTKGAAKATNTSQSAESFAEFIVRSDRRSKALEGLRGSSSLLVQELLRLRSLTNTVLFPSATSTSGQAIDAAIAITGLLASEAQLSPGFSNSILAMATDANRGGSPQPVEQVLMNLMSLGQRFDWQPLAGFVRPIDSAETLRVLTALIRSGDGVPVIYAAVSLTGNASGVAKYLSGFSKTGLSDLRLSLNYGAGGVNQLLNSNRRLCDSRLCEQMAALTARTSQPIGLDFARKEPGLALSVKWLLYLLGGFFAAGAFHYGRRVTALEKPLEVRGFHLVRELLFALGFLLVVLLLSEPFLSQGSQKLEIPFRLHLPTVGSAAPAGNSLVPKSLMNPGILLTLLLFFVLQGLIYVVCLVKLAEIRRQRVPPRIKLKLLENEEHLFDAGLYLGFVGTIISLILVSLNVIHFSLMAAYSCTCFGIVFVVVFKIFHLRSTRRKLLLEAEAESPEAAAPSQHAYVAPV